MSVDRSNRVRRVGWMLACATLLWSGCDFVDPTQVTNPNTTDRDLAEAAEPTTALLPGLRAQMARTVRAVVQTTDIVSDNFEIAFTNITGELDDPYLVAPDGGSYNSTGSIGAYWNTQELRALSDFVIDSIAPEDETATDAQLAEAHYYRGMAYLMQGENFIAVPTAADQEPTGWDGLLGHARDDFEAALALAADAELQIALQGALARTHRALGNATEAAQYAADALAADPEFVHLQPYDANNLQNSFPNNLRNMQPLPRLDFLDPKYNTRETGIPLSKAEEMHLILAEVAMAAGDYGEAANELSSALEIAADRPTGTMTDEDLRLNADLTVRPRNSEVLVRADADSPARAGLVLDRPGPIEVPTISGTSLDADSVANLTDPEALRHSLWLARQEILFLEGRRLHDLGVRLPIIAREIDSSPAIERGDPATDVDVPDYIPEGMIDDFSPRSPYADATVGEELDETQITIAIDMNRVLAQERVSPVGPLQP